MAQMSTRISRSQFTAIGKGFTQFDDSDKQLHPAVTPKELTSCPRW